MRIRCIVGVLVLVVVSLSFAVPAEDTLDTAYDESESLPFLTDLLISMGGCHV